MSNNMPYERKGEKVKPGIYRVYNGSPVEVIMMVPEPETGKEFVICKKWRFVRNKDYFVVSKEKFYSEVEDKYGQKHQLYRYDDSYEEQLSNLEDIEEDGFNVRERIIRMEKKAHRFDDTYLKSRRLRSSPSYTEYAKEILLHKTKDEARVRLCRSEKKYVGIKKEDYNILVSDLKFLDICLKGPLAPFADFINERFGEEPKSIREYAAAHDINRGSVEHIQRKMILAFAEELKRRDEADGIKRIKEPVLYDYSAEDEDDEENEEQAEETKITDEEYLLSLLNDVLDRKHSEDEIRKAINNRFGSADVEDKLCHDVCTFLLICCGSKNPVKLNRIYDLKNKLKKRIAEQSKV